MSKFLTGQKLSKAIRKIVSGRDVKCAVAYWGEHRFGKKWHAQEGVQIVCDIVGGSTSRQALEALGAPTNPNLKHFENLHAKVYISDQGVIIGSANASARGLGDPKGKPHLLEAGVFHKPKGEIWKGSVEWFDDLYKDAKKIDAVTLSLAQALHRPPFARRPSDFAGLSMLEQIMHCPQHFEEQGFGFVVSPINAKPENREKAYQQVSDANKDKPEIAETIRKWPGVAFLDWPPADMQALRANFVSFHVAPRGGLELSQHCYKYRFDGVSEKGKGHFYTLDAIPKATLPDGTPMQDRKTVGFDDREQTVLRHISTDLLRENEGGGIFSARQFADLLKQGFDAVDG